MHPIRMKTLFFPALFRVRRIQFGIEDPIFRLNNPPPPPANDDQGSAFQPFSHSFIHSAASHHPSQTVDSSDRTSSAVGLCHKENGKYSRGAHLIMDDARRHTPHDSRAIDIGSGRIGFGRPSFEYIYQSDSYWIFRPFTGSLRYSPIEGAVEKDIADFSNSNEYFHPMG